MTAWCMLSGTNGGGLRFEQEDVFLMRPKGHVAKDLCQSFVNATTHSPLVSVRKVASVSL